MNISIPNQYDSFIKAQISSGKFHSADDVISAALRIMERDGESRENQLSWLQSKLEASWAQMENGEVISATEFEGNA